MTFAGSSVLGCAEAGRRLFYLKDVGVDSTIMEFRKGSKFWKTHEQFCTIERDGRDRNKKGTLPS